MLNVNGGPWYGWLLKYAMILSLSKIAPIMYFCVKGDIFSVAYKKKKKKIET